jgi:organic radical activating enzyme
MDYNYVCGRSNLALTIFVPYDCDNNCPFCTSKIDYRDTSKFVSARKMAGEAMLILKNEPMIKDVVITGGEPFTVSHLSDLETLLKAVCNKGRRVYINSTLPTNSPEDIKKVCNVISKYNIDGINVSRHISVKVNANDNLLDAINHWKLCHIRVNSVLYGDNITIDDIKNFISKYGKYGEIQFRADYRKVVSYDDLKGFDAFCLELAANGFKYAFGGGCQVCNTDRFLYDNKYYIAYHRGFQNSLLKIENNLIVNDIVMFQNGKTYVDWSKEHEVEASKFPIF